MLTSPCHNFPRYRAVVVMLICLTSQGVVADEVREQLQLRLEAAEAEAPQGARDGDREALRRFYLDRDFRPLWIDGGGANAQARALASRLVKAEQDGLYPADYDAAFIARNLDSGNAAARADVEFKLSRALLRYGGDLSAGRVDPARIDKELNIHPSAVHQADLLGAAGDADFDAYLAALAPQSKNYARLKAALRDYRRLAAAGGWGTVPESKTLKPGLSDAAVLPLRRRLQASGELDAATPLSEHFDEALEAAVKSFQYRHGLTVDGAVGKNTRAALNVTVGARIERKNAVAKESRAYTPVGSLHDPTHTHQTAGAGGTGDTLPDPTQRRWERPIR